MHTCALAQPLKLIDSLRWLCPWICRSAPFKIVELGGSRSDR